MTVEKTANGKWALKDGDKVICTYSSNREAWRAADVLSDSPLSRQESVTQWVARRMASEGYT